MMVLDTHALIWWVSDAPELSRVAKNAIHKTLRANQRLLVSAITAWEIALLVKKTTSCVDHGRCRVDCCNGVHRGDSARTH